MRRLQRKLEEFAGPRWPPKVRTLIVLVVVIAAYVCAHWRLMHAREFGALAILFGVFLLFRPPRSVEMALPQHHLTREQDLTSRS